MRILTVNAGSSNLKLRLLDPGDGLAGSTELRVGDGGIDPRELAAALHGLGPADAVGHRIVHGGTDFTAPVRIGPTSSRGSSASPTWRRCTSRPRCAPWRR